MSNKKTVSIDFLDFKISWFLKWVNWFCGKIDLLLKLLFSVLQPQLFFPISKLLTSFDNLDRIELKRAKKCHWVKKTKRQTDKQTEEETFSTSKCKFYFSNWI